MRGWPVSKVRMEALALPSVLFNFRVAIREADAAKSKDWMMMKIFSCDINISIRVC